MRILSKEDAYFFDNYTINDLGVSGISLMESAASSLLFSIYPYIQKNKRIIFFIGHGNNGGDGLALCRRLLNLGFDCYAFLVCGDDKFQGEALEELNIYKNHKYPLFHNNMKDFAFDDITFDSYNDLLLYSISNCDFIVDSVYGIGFKGELGDNIKPIFEMINNSQKTVFSIDLPSGVSCDGKYFNGAIKASYTFSILGAKESAFIYPSSSYFGEIISIDIGIYKKAKNTIKETWNFPKFSLTLPFKDNLDYKKSSGYCLIVGGSKFYKGAPILAANGALKSGVGLISLAIPNDIVNPASNKLLEAIYSPIKEKDGYLCDISIDENIDVIVCGIGLSRQKCCKNVVKKVIMSDKIIILDADALYFLDDELLNILKARKQISVLTPHIGEMARLCGVSSKEVEKNKFSLSLQKALKWNCYIVLKGANTLITSNKGEQIMNAYYNPALAKGGSGDTLAGIISSFLAYYSKVDFKQFNNHYNFSFFDELSEKLSFNINDYLSNDNNYKKFSNYDVNRELFCYDKFLLAISNAVFAHNAAANYALCFGQTPLDFSISDISSSLKDVFNLALKFRNENYIS